MAQVLRCLRDQAQVALRHQGWAASQCFVFHYSAKAEPAREQQGMMPPFSGIPTQCTCFYAYTYLFSFYMSSKLMPANCIVP